MLASDKSTKLVESLIQNPTGHAYLLIAADAQVATHAAQELTAGWMNITTSKVTEHPYIKLISPDKKGIISIDEIRKLTAFCRLKVLSADTIQRVVIVNQASTMTAQAQNSLLKLLEEPPAGTMIVLTAQDATTLMPTIRSRVQAVELPLPTEQEILQYFSAQGYEEKGIKRAYALQGANTDAVNAYLEHTSESDTPLATAKWLLGSSKYDRLCEIDALAKNKEAAAAVVGALATVSSSALEATASDPAKLARWHDILRSCVLAQDALQKNTNTKLVLTELFLKI